MTAIRLAIDARNPGEYLAVCGLIELIGRIDHACTSVWTRRSGVVPGVHLAAADVCEIDSGVSEARVAGELGTALGTRSAWRAVTATGRVPLADSIGSWTAGIEIDIACVGEMVVIDHWYEDAFVKDDNIVSKGDVRNGRRGWKFWAGQQDKNKGMSGLILDLVDAAATMRLPMCLQDVLEHRVVGRAPLKIDAATTRSSIDRGISANDAEKEKALFVRPGLELIAAIGMSTFFPPRRYGDAAPDGTVGIHGRVFRYRLWRRVVPVAIARVIGRGSDAGPFEGASFEAGIGGKEYAYLKFARAAGVTGISGDEAIDEESSDD